MDSTASTTLVMGNDLGKFNVETKRDEAGSAWHITVKKETQSKPMMSGCFPTNFDNDKRTAREFLRELVSAWWPTSLAADMARKDSRWAKRNRSKVM